VAGRKDGRWVYYSLVPEALEELQAALAELREDGTDTELCLDHC
jgi:DNA-binding transcriptional ArsR family regulator